MVNRDAREATSIFADVRHFEEIFREGEAPPGGEPSAGQMSGNAQQSEELLQTQKQIIVGHVESAAPRNTTLRKQRPLPKMSSYSLSHSKKLSQHSSSSANESRMPNPLSIVQEVQQSMTQSVEYLQRAAKEQAVEPLPDCPDD